MLLTDYCGEFPFIGLVYNLNFECTNVFSQGKQSGTMEPQEMNNDSGSGPLKWLMVKKKGKERTREVAPVWFLTEATCMDDAEQRRAELGSQGFKTRVELIRRVAVGKQNPIAVKVVAECFDMRRYLMFLLSIVIVAIYYYFVEKK